MLVPSRKRIFWLGLAVPLTVTFVSNVTPLSGISAPLASITESIVGDIHPAISRSSVAEYSYRPVAARNNT